MRVSDIPSGADGSKGARVQTHQVKQSRREIQLTSPSQQRCSGKEKPALSTDQQRKHKQKGQQQPIKWHLQLQGPQQIILPCVCKTEDVRELNLTVLIKRIHEQNEL